MKGITGVNDRKRGICKIAGVLLFAAVLTAGLCACGKAGAQNGQNEPGRQAGVGEAADGQAAGTGSGADKDLTVSQGTVMELAQRDSASSLEECSSAMDVACKAGGIAVMKDGSLLVTDLYHKVIWQVKDGVSTVFAGAETVLDLYGEPIGAYNDSEQTKSYFAMPWAVAPFLGGWAVSDTENNAIRLIKDGQVQTVNAKTTEKLKTGKLGVIFDHPTGLASDTAGNLYVADTHNGAVRKISSTGTVTTCADGLQGPTGLYWKDGILYIAETEANRILKCVNGKCEVLAGSGENEYADGPAKEAAFSFPQGLTVGENGEIYVADTGNSAVRMIKDGEVTTILYRDKTLLELDLVSPVSLLLQGEELYIGDSFTKKLLRVTL